MTTETATGRPDVLGPYLLQGMLGRGGMGEVHRAFDTRRGRVVALKILQSDLARDEAFRARFRRESDTAARLQNPHVIPIHDFGEIDGRLYIDMRLVEGSGLDRLIAAGPLDPRRAVALITQVAEALADAHRNGILHRDIKPSNILVTPADFVYLVDFGIARALGDNVTALTSVGVAVGTLAYMAPERFGDGVPDARSDVYSLTCTLVECLTGRRPFPATDLPGLMHAHLTADPPRPSLERRAVPPALDDVIARGMAKDPAARFTTPTELAAAAQQALELWGHTVPSVRRPVAEPPRRARTAALATGAVLIALASGGIGFAVGRSGAPDP
uniref:serine/threonine-protein kinase n=1 Tax=Pseudonocardia lacus TaxID=2835865 RepID=UPI0027E37851